MDPTAINTFLNTLIPLIVVVVGILIYIAHHTDLWSHANIIDFKDRPATSLGFLFLIIWFATQFIAYSMLKYAPIIKTSPIILMVLNVGYLALLGFSVAYRAGNTELDLKKLFKLLVIAFTLYLLFHAGMFSVFFQGKATPLHSIWLCAPSGTLSSVAMAMFGWSILIRWGRLAIPFFVITIVYATALLPAFLMAFVFLPEDYAKTFENFIPTFEGKRDIPKGVTQLFTSLAIGKLVIAVYAFTLLLSPADCQPEMGKAQYWTTKEDIKVHPYVRYVVRGLMLFLITTLAAVLHDKIKAFLNGL
jgi:hypothetical protein